MHQNIEISLVQSIQNLRLGRRFTFQQDNDPKHTARVAYRQLCECSWVAQPQPELEPNQIFLEKPENVLVPSKCVPIQPDRAWEVKRWGEEWPNCQMLMIKACLIKQKKTWGSKGVSVKYLVKGMNTSEYDNSVFALSLWCMECRLMC